MFHRNTQPTSRSHADPSAEFQEDVVDLVSEGLCCGKRISRMLAKAHKAGVKGISPKIRKAGGKNHARAIQRHTLRVENGLNTIGSNADSMTGKLTRRSVISYPSICL